MIATQSNTEESNKKPSKDDKDVANLGLMAILDNDVQIREHAPEIQNNNDLTSGI